MLGRRLIRAAIILVIAAILGVSYAVYKEKATAFKPSPLPELPTSWGKESNFKSQRVDIGLGRALKVILPPGKESGEGLPLVVVGVAGSRLVHGMPMDENPEELYPYANAGFVVIAFGQDGEYEGEKISSDEAKKAIELFVSADGRVKNAQQAIDYGIEKVGVDPKNVFVSGHSSAATIALQVAMADNRVKAGVAFAPVTDVRGYLGDYAPHFENEVFGFRKWLKARDPMPNVQKIKVPFLIFHADDDSIVDKPMIDQFVAKLTAQNPKSQFVHVATGDHYDSMIDEGFKSAVPFLKSFVN